MSQLGTDQIMHLAQPAIARRTWRLCFRIFALFILIAIVITQIFMLTFDHTLLTTTQFLTSIGNLQSTITSWTPDVQAMLSISNQLIYTTSITLPLKISTTEMSILTAIRDHCHCPDCSSACPTRQMLLNDPRYMSGVNQFIGAPTESINITFGPLLGIPSFIPTSTTTQGCIRIPSFALGPSHWCYTHNFITAGCADGGHSNQYLAMGTIQSASDGSPLLITAMSYYLSGGVNRKSCSIAVVPGGCAMYCYVATRSETDYYAGNSPPQQLLTLVFSNDTIIERTIHPTGLANGWVMLVPRVGSGIIYKEYLLFPAYEGRQQILANQSGEINQFFTPYNATVRCAMAQPQFSQRAAASYYPRYFSNRWIRSAIVACPYRAIYQTQCTLIPLPNRMVMMGSEGRIFTLGDRLFYYQRSSSWWPYPLLYQVGLNFLTTPPSVSSMTQVPLEHLARPGKGGCPGNSHCPATCVTGVYADVWPLTDPRSGVGGTSLVAAGGLDSTSERMAPANYLAIGESLLSKTYLLSKTQPAAYTTTTCFRDTDTGKIYCITIAELGKVLLGEFQIVPFLREIKIQSRY
uniref:Attachment protein n=1 Tax=La Piedad-Michoacan-Mexico virus TaxID=3052562 RepID=A0A1P8D892_LPMV|nr:attachment protein [Orthorubulavirus suis]